jgi:hypothetical protein
VGLRCGAAAVGVGQGGVGAWSWGRSLSLPPLPCLSVSVFLSEAEVWAAAVMMMMVTMMMRIMMRGWAGGVGAWSWGRVCVGASMRREVLLRNCTDAECAITADTDGPPFEVEGPAVVAPRARVRLVVTFAPLEVW